MVRTCLYCGRKSMCKGDYSFFKFPLTNRERLQQWAENMGVDINMLTPYSRLCSDHFEKSCMIKKDTLMSLTSNAVPTLFECQKNACVSCKSKKGEKKERTFHRFPMKKLELLERWKTQIKRPNFKPTGSSLLCSDHFNKICFRQFGVLKNDAVPTIFRDNETVAGNSSTAVSQNDTFFSTSTTKEAKKENKRVHSVEYSNNVIFSSAADDNGSKTKCHNYGNDDDGIGTVEPFEAVFIPSAFEESNTQDQAILAAASITDDRELVIKQEIDVTIKKSLSDDIHAPSPTTPKSSQQIARRILIEHCYENSLQTIKKKYEKVCSQLEKERKEKKALKHKIARLTYKVTCLKDIVSILKKERCVPTKCCTPS